MPDEEKLDRLEEMVEAVLKFDTDTAEGQRHARSMCGQIFRLGHEHGWDKHVAVVRQRDRGRDEAGAVTRLVAGASRRVVWFEERDAGEMFKAEVGIWLDEKGYTAYVMGGLGNGGMSAPARGTRDEARAEVARLWSRLYG
jgi:hypothetical protein